MTWFSFYGATGASSQMLILVTSKSYQGYEEIVVPIDRMAIHVAALQADSEKRGSYDEFTRRALEKATAMQRRSQIDSADVGPPESKLLPVERMLRSTAPVGAAAARTNRRRRKSIRERLIELSE